MNGATAELWVKIIKRPNRTKTMIIGMSHHSFLCQRKTMSSPKIPNLETKFFTAPIPAFYSIIRIYFFIMKFSSTKTSIPLLLKVLKALAGEFTIGSPLKLKDVLRSTGTPVSSPNFFTIR